MDAWTQTFTGKKFCPLDPRGEDVDIWDIAHSLSQMCRFAGHCDRYYSVAQHSVHVSTLVSPANALWGLLHDATEAYLCDIPRPLKPLLVNYREAEARLMAVIAEVFGLRGSMPIEVRRADDVALATEKRDLMKPAPAAWGPLPDPDPTPIVPLLPFESEHLFLSRFRELIQYEGSVALCQKGIAGVISHRVGEVWYGRTVEGDKPWQSKFPKIVSLKREQTA